MRKLLPHMPVVAPTAFRFANYLACSANADILLFYFGWVLRLPLGGWVLRLPFMPRLANFLVKWLPRWPVRGRRARGPAEAARVGWRHVLQHDGPREEDLRDLR